LSKPGKAVFVFAPMAVAFGPGPVRALQASRPVGAGPDAPHTHPHTTQTHHLVPLGLLPPLGTGESKSIFFSAARLLSCRRSGSGEPHGSAANLTPPAMAPLPPTAGVKGTPAMYLDSQRHASVMDKRAGPFTPGPAQANKSSTLLVQAVPQRQQTPTDGQ
jgi:hypothetical protein